MLDGQVALLTLAAARYFALGEVPQRLGTEHPGRVPSASFRCADGGWLHITASDQHWMPLCKVLGIESWGADPALLSNSERVRRREEVMANLGAAISTRKRPELGAAFDAAGVPAGPVNAVDEVLADPHVLARNMVAKFAHPAIGEFPALPVPLKFVGWDDPVVARPPMLGEHTDAILSQRLGLDAAAIAKLRQANAI